VFPKLKLVSMGVGDHRQLKFEKSDYRREFYAHSSRESLPFNKQTALLATSWAWLKQSVKTDRGLVPVKTEFLSKGDPSGVPKKREVPLDPLFSRKVRKGSQGSSI